MRKSFTCGPTKGKKNWNRAGKKQGKKYPTEKSKSVKLREPGDECKKNRKMDRNCD